MNRSPIKRKTPVKKRNKSPEAKAKAKCWTAFSRYIRMRDALATTGTVDEAKCVTCGVRSPIKKMQAGHFIPGRRNSILLDPRNCSCQCLPCNMYKGGNQVEYYVWMLEHHGQEVIDVLRRMNNTTRKFTVEQLDDMRAQFEAKTEEMEATP